MFSNSNQFKWKKFLQKKKINTNICQNLTGINYKLHINI